MRERSLQTTRLGEKEEEVLHVLEQREVALQSMKTMVKHVVPLYPMEDNSGADIHPVGVGNPIPQQKKKKNLKEDADCGQPTQQPVERSPQANRFSGRACSPWGTHTVLSPVPEGLYPLERTYAGTVHEWLCTMGRNPCQSRGKAWDGRRGRDTVL